MKYKAIIFDMDGTIVDTEEVWFEANRRFLESRGISFTPELEGELRRRIHGMALEESCKVIKELTALKDPLEVVIEQHRMHARLVYKKGIRFIEGFEAFHSRVIKRELKSGVATNADDYTLAITKEALPIERFFGNHIYNISSVGNVPKPDPAIYLYVAQKLGLEPSLCLAIEDSAHGIKAAQGAGMFCIGINTSKNYEQVKEANTIVENYSDIDLHKFLL